MTTTNPQQIQISEFDYTLPDEKIAKFPLSVRDESKLLVYRHGNLSESKFYSLPQFIDTSELIIFNNTKVIHARLHFYKETGASIEVFCLEPHCPNDYVTSFQQNRICNWLCLIGNLKKWKSGSLHRSLLIKGQTTTLTAKRKNEVGTSHEVEFTWDNPKITFADILEHFGELPIPPYLNRETKESDKETYQTVYSKIKGSVAAPTAGLHFTQRVIDELQSKGIELQEITLHVGAGTFRPVKAPELAKHKMHTEYIAVSKATLNKIIEHNSKAVAVGTTSVRTIESLYYIGAKLIQNKNLEEHELHVEQWEPYKNKLKYSPCETLQAIVDYMEKHSLETLHSSTQIIIAPGYEYHFINKMITNFHQPQSTLLLLVSAFVKGNWRSIYNYALNHDFRFLSYGDSSILIP